MIEIAITTLFVKEIAVPAILLLLFGLTDTGDEDSDPGLPPGADDGSNNMGGPCPIY